MANAGEIKAKLVLDNAQFKRGMQEAQTQMQQTSKSSKNTSDGMSALGKASAVAGVAIVASVGASVKAAANFEQSMAKVKAISGATDSEFKQLENTAKHLGATTQFSASQAADGLAFLSLAGFKAQDSINAMPAVLNLAAAGAIDLGTAADISSNIMTGFGIAATDTGKAADVLTKTFTTANTDMSQLGMAMKYVAPVAKSLGWDITDAATAVAKMSDAGIQGSQAGTSLRAALLSLANPTGQTQKAFEKLGISVVDANGQFKPLPELIGHISSKMDGMTDAQKTVTAAQLVGTEASAGFLALLAQGQPALQQYKTTLEESGGTAERVARIQQETLLGAWNQLKSAAEGLAINLGQSLLPAFTAVAQGAAALVGGLAQLDPAFLAGGLAAAAFAAGAVLVYNNIGKITTAMRLLGATLISNPATAWIAGVSLAVGALTTVLMKASGSAREYKEVSLDAYKSLGEQADGMYQLADRHDALKKKINLTTDEMLRYRDLTTEIHKAEEGDSKQKLINEYEQLGKKSGATKEELNEYLEVNAEIIAKAPATEQAFDKKGNAIAKTSDEARKLGDSYKEMQRIELELQQTQLMINQKKDLEDMVEASKNYNEALKDRAGLVKNQADAQKGYDKARREYNDAVERGDERQIENASQYLARKRETLTAANTELAVNKAAGTELKGQMNAAQQRLQLSEKTTNAVIEEHAAAVGITGAVGELSGKVNERLSAEQNVLSELDKQKKSGEGLSKEQEQQYESASKQVEKLKEAKSAIDQAKENHASYKQGVDETTESIELMNDALEKPTDKKVKTNIDEEKKKADELQEKSEKEAVKKTKGDTSDFDKKNAEADKKGSKENTKKTKGDTEDFKKKNAEADKAAQKENTKKTKGDISDAQNKNMTIEEEMRREVQKNLNMDASQAKRELDAVKKEATKAETKPLHIRVMESVTRTVSEIFSSREKRHNGGTLSQTMKKPKYHNGGSPYGLAAHRPKFDEVDVRLLKNEMVLTQAQQANLFKALETASRPSVGHDLFGAKSNRGTGGNTTVNVNLSDVSIRDDRDIDTLADQLVDKIDVRLRHKQRSMERARGY
ncbi:tail protein [Bacillus sp. L_1B0_8]|uniref:phage tail tape measure protein n=1 Tax=unclassified Bacillus (in: firmicutes) TaxID=185979 RepID=UPI0005B6C1AA|nr:MULTISPECIES: phage tail tape measure protein [unclassified Bacillus (in: firmicutes)]KIQ89864.1 tail protein [Bacillus sp. L_1B0_5]KIQ91404.1 tail protein [Bacillus sp. L_1B0_8]